MRATLLSGATLLLTALGGCGSNQTNHYQKGVSAQEKCCNRLSDSQARGQCLQEIVRVDSRAAEESPTNQATYRCVQRYFECNVQTGRATQRSAQAQLDCLSDQGIPGGESAGAH